MAIRKPEINEDLRMRKAFIFAISLMVISSLHAEETYHYRIAAELSDGSGGVESQRLGISYFADGIDTSLGPIAASEFLSRSTRVSLSFNNYDDPGFDDETVALAARMFGRSQKNFMDIFLDDMQFNGQKTEHYGIGIGRYMTDRASLSLLVSRIEFGSDFELDRFIGNIKYLSESKLKYKIDMSLGLVNGTAPIANVSITDEKDVYDLFAELKLSIFPNNNTSLTVGTTIYTRTLRSVLVEFGGDPEPTTADDLAYYFINYHYFFGTDKSIGVTYGEKNNDFFYDDSEYISVSFSKYF